MVVGQEEFVASEFGGEALPGEVGGVPVQQRMKLGHGNGAGGEGDVLLSLGHPILHPGERVGRQVDAAGGVEHAPPGNIIALAVEVGQSVEDLPKAVAITLQHVTLGTAEARDKPLGVALRRLRTGEITRHHALEEVRRLVARARLLQGIDGVRRVLDHHRATMGEMVAAFQEG